MDVDVLLKELSGRQFMEWLAYSELEPFGEERADLRLAAILRMIFAINRDTKEVPEVPGIGAFYANFLVDLQDYLKPPEERRGIAKTQTWQQQKAILLEHAVRAAVAHEAEQRKIRHSRSRSRKAS